MSKHVAYNAINKHGRYYLLLRSKAFEMCQAHPIPSVQVVELWLLPVPAHDRTLPPPLTLFLSDSDRLLFRRSALSTPMRAVSKAPKHRTLSVIVTFTAVQQICSARHSKHTRPATGTLWFVPEVSRTISTKKTISAFSRHWPWPLTFQGQNFNGAIKGSPRNILK